MKSDKKKDSFIKKNFRVLSFGWKVGRGFFVSSIIRSLILSALPFVSIHGANLLIDGIIQGKDTGSLMVIVYWMAGVLFVGGIASAALNTLNSSLQNKTQIRLEKTLAEKTFSLSYEQNEDFETMRLIEMAQEGSNGSGDITYYITNVASTIQCLASIVYSVILLLPLFQQSGQTFAEPLPQYLDSVYAPLTIVGFVGVAAITEFFLAKLSSGFSYRAMMDNVDSNRKFGYFYQVSQDYEIGKDIRLYHLQPFIMKEQSDPKNSVNKAWDAYSWKQIGINSCVVFLNVLIALTAYLIIGLRAGYGLTSTGSVVAMVGAATLLASSLNKSVTLIAFMNLCADYLQNYFIYMALPSKVVYGGKKIDEKAPITIVFKDVTFTYPGQKEPALKGLNLTIKPGERFAIVGLNGAGKSTLVKLLCRYYNPDSGSILLNDEPIENYDAESLYRLFAVVFQDFKLFSYSIRENVYCGTKGDEEKATDALRRSGILPRVETMPRGLDTIIYQKNDEDGVEISGGEAQKIAIARALYKDSPIVILDEPTSALDPKSEAEIYDKFASLIKGKTAIFISHRMSSTRDSDEIAVIKDGKTIELGDHATLMKKAGGLYRQMWEAQAQYYR